jgi:uncharacterized protein YdaU (DUF1376 family)
LPGRRGSARWTIQTTPKRVNLDRDILNQVLDDLQSDAFVKALVAEARKASMPVPDADVAPMREKVSDLTRKIGRATELAMEAQQPRPWLEKIERLEKERAAFVEQLGRAEAETRAAEAMRDIRESDVRAILNQMAQGVNIDSETGALKDFLRDLVEWVELEDSTCRNHYLLSAGGVCLASPRRFGIETLENPGRSSSKRGLIVAKYGAFQQIMREKNHLPRGLVASDSHKESTRFIRD